MAYTVSKTNSVFGDKRAVILNITADAATQTVETGLSYIDGFMTGPKSLTTAAIKIYNNVSASGVAANGSIGISGVASGDQFCVVVVGR